MHEVFNVKDFFHFEVHISPQYFFPFHLPNILHLELLLLYPSLPPGSMHLSSPVLAFTRSGHHLGCNYHNLN